MSYRRTWIKRCAGALALAALSFLPGAGSAAPGGVAEFDVKSAYIYNFIQLVDWPARENGAAAGPIKIYVIGGASLGEALAGLKDGIAVDGVFYGSIEASLDREQGSNAWLTIGLREGKTREN